MLLLEKQCTKCKQTLPIQMFAKDSRVNTGLRRQCRNCCAEVRNLNTSHHNAVKKQRIQTVKKKFNKIAEHSVYLFASPLKPEHVKIGYTSNLYTRAQALLSATSESLLLIALLKVDSPKDESFYHFRFDKFRIKGTEWFVAKTPLIQFVSSLDQSLAHQSLKLLPLTQQSRIIIPSIDSWIDSLPFLG